MQKQQHGFIKAFIWKAFVADFLKQFAKTETVLEVLSSVWIKVWAQILLNLMHH